MNESAAKIGVKVPSAPRVSVIMPVYNVASFIAETLESVLAQTFQNYEIILVNDGSKDTPELKSALAPFWDFLVYVEQANVGCAAARNTAIALSRGELLAFLDGDDIWFPTFLESQLNFLDKNDLEMVYSDALIFGEPLFENQNFMGDAASVKPMTTVNLIRAECNIVNSGAIIKKSLTEKFGAFNADVIRAQDFDLWFRLAKNGVRAGFNDEILLKYRVRPDNLSGGNVARAERNISILEIIREKYDLNEAETTAWEQQIALCRAELELEKGKFSLTQGDYEQARAHLVKANKFYRKPKFFALTLLLKVSPRLTTTLFKTLRPAEFAFIAPENDK